jgi:beta-lactamase superfamily II metal-dependent hydrolase
MIVSHYHADHFGCTTEVLDEFPLKVYAYDRPGAYNSKTFSQYVQAVGNKRKQVYRTTKIILDADSEHPVRINIAGYNGAGVRGADDENDRSVAAVIHFGNFNVMMAGDLSGYTKKQYTDVETAVAKKVGQMEVYKVNHHGSEYSSNPTWLKKLSPRVAIISAGLENSYRHPTPGALMRIHSAGVEKTYWTSEGNGASPVAGKDVVADGSIVIEVSAGSDRFTVKYGDESDSFEMWPKPYRGRR